MKVALSSGEKTEALEVATRAARAAGAVLLGYRGEHLKVRSKGVVDMVSQADLASEALLREAILSAFPDDEILAEELGSRAGASGRRWIVDPLDGTTNFVHGMPHFSVSVALEAEGQVQVAVVFDPSRDELFQATLDGGARLNGSPLVTSGCADLSAALLGTGFPYDRRDHLDAYLAYVRAFLDRCHGIRRVGSAALDLAFVAAGRLDGFWEFKLQPWDVAAGRLLVEEAGGVISSSAGHPYSWGDGLIVAASAGLHPRLIEVIEQVRSAGADPC